MKIYIADSIQNIYKKGLGGNQISRLKKGEIALLLKKRVIIKLYICYIPKLQKIATYHIHVLYEG